MYFFTAPPMVKESLESGKKWLSFGAVSISWCRIRWTDGMGAFDNNLLRIRESFNDIFLINLWHGLFGKRIAKIRQKLVDLWSSIVSIRDTPATRKTIDWRTMMHSIWIQDSMTKY
jgi:hypothetical protein